VGLLRPSRSRPRTTSRHSNPPQTLSILKKVNIIPWMLKSSSGLCGSWWRGSPHSLETFF
jgi:hypothetical protein